MRLPKYRHHKPSGRAVIQWLPLFGKSPHYLPGVYGSKESRDEYERIRSQILATHYAGHPPPQAPPGQTTLAAIFDAFLDHAKVYYESKNEYDHFRAVVKILNATFPPETRAADFGPMALKKARETMIVKGWARGHVNHQVERIKRAFKWAVENELVDEVVLAKLRLVAGLRKGKTPAPDRPRVTGVPWEVACQVLPFVSPIVAAMIEVHFLAGMRSGELCGMTPGEIERRPGLWVYSPAQHKNAWREKPRVIVMGPRAIELCSRYAPDVDTDCFFRPSVAVAELAARRSARRQTPHTPSSRARKATPRRCGIAYTSHSYWLAIRHGFIAMARANGAARKEKPSKGKGNFAPWLAKYRVPYWHPHQLRHARATLTRDVYGEEGTQAILGDSPEATKRYGERSLALASKIAAEQG